jgi:hypothetical protein
LAVGAGVSVKDKVERHRRNEDKVMRFGGKEKITNTCLRSDFCGFSQNQVLQFYTDGTLGKQTLMKTKVAATFFLIVFVNLSVVAQKKENSTGKFSLSPGPVAAIPVGALEDNLRMGFGGGLRAYYSVTNKFHVGVHPSYLHFGGQRNRTREGNTSKTELHSSLGLLQLAFTADYTIAKEFFIGAGAGLGWGHTGRSRYEESTIIPGGSGSFITATLEGDNSNGFSFSPYAGVNIKFLQLIISYTTVAKAYSRTLYTGKIKDLSFVALTTAYRFGKQ